MALDRPSLLNIPGRIPRIGGLVPALSPYWDLVAHLDPTVLDAVDQSGIRFYRPFDYGEKVLPTVAVFHCPSDRAVLGGTNYRANLGIGPGLRSGGSCDSPGNTTGAFVAWREVSLSTFIDGTSATALFSERVVGDGDIETYSPFSDIGIEDASVCTVADALDACSGGDAPGAAHASLPGYYWFPGSLYHTWYLHLLGPNSRIPDCVQGHPAAFSSGNGRVTARSHHPGGVHVLFADGAVRMIADSVDIDVWRALGTRAGREVPGIGE